MHAAVCHASAVEHISDNEHARHVTGCGCIAIASNSTGEQGSGAVFETPASRQEIDKGQADTCGILPNTSTSMRLLRRTSHGQR
jgi:hypothetical protein